MAGRFQNGWDRITRDLDQYGNTPSTGGINVPKDMPNARRRKGGMPGAARERIRQGLSNPPSNGAYERAMFPTPDAPEPEPVNYTEGDIPALCRRLGIDYDKEFGPYTVTPLDDDPANYGAGPDSSTRLVEHQFIVDKGELLSILLDIIDGNLSVQFFGTLVEGHTSVTWRKKGNTSMYGPMTLAEYRTFRDHNSKGSYINGPFAAYYIG